MSSSSDNNLNELNVFQLFVHLFETKSIEEVNTKVNRLKDKDDIKMACLCIEVLKAHTQGKNTHKHPI